MLSRPSEETRSGTITAHGHTWPIYERPAFQVKVEGFIDRDDVQSAEALRTELEAVLAPYGVTVQLVAVTVNEMAPEDLAERQRLDEEAIAASRN